MQRWWKNSRSFLLPFDWCSRQCIAKHALGMEDFEKAFVATPTWESKDYLTKNWGELSKWGLFARIYSPLLMQKTSTNSVESYHWMETLILKGIYCRFQIKLVDLWVRRFREAGIKNRDNFGRIRYLNWILIPAFLVLIQRFEFHLLWWSAPPLCQGPPPSMSSHKFPLYPASK